jgi:hypothetical protein
LLAVRGIKVKPNKDIINGNIVVFSSSSGAQSSSAYNAKQHGYFTYFLLKKLQESKGTVSFDDLDSYLKTSVGKRAGLDGNIQTPEVNVGLKVQNNWKNLTLQ